MKSLSRIPSVTRWLIVVVAGCAVLETVQPANAAEPATSETPAISAVSPPETSLAPATSATTALSPARSTSGPGGDRSIDTVLYPQGSKDRPASAHAGDRRGSSSFWLVGAFLLAATGGWLVLRRRGLPLSKVIRTDRLIQIEETKSLGNRQYLVVASCEGRRFLIGVTPGQIQLLTPLEDADADARDATDGSPAK